MNIVLLDDAELADLRIIVDHALRVDPNPRSFVYGIRSQLDVARRFGADGGVCYQMDNVGDVHVWDMRREI